MEMTPIEPDRAVPPEVVEMAHGYLVAAGLALPDDPGQLGEAMPTELYEAWTSPRRGMVDAVAAWIERHEELSYADAPWLIRWAQEHYQGRFISRESWAEEEIGRHIDWYGGEYSVSLADLVDWSAAADEAEHDEEVLLFPVDPLDSWSDLFAFAGRVEDLDEFRDDWLNDLRVDALMARLRLEVVHADGTTEQEAVADNEQAVRAILNATRGLGLAPAGCEFTDKIRDWVDRAPRLPRVGITVHDDTYRLVYADE